MASNQTSNYGLNQWEATDQVLRTEFNADNLKVDTALKNQATSISNLAVQITDGLAEKAAKSDLEAETAARETADGTLDQQVNEISQRAGLQMIKTITVDSTCTSFQVPLDGLDWKKWKAVHMMTEIAGTASSSGYVKINGNKFTTIKSDSHSTPDAREIFGHLIFFPMYDDRSWLRAICWEDRSLQTAARRYRDIDTIEIVFDSPIQILAGTKVTLWGEK